MGCYTATTVDAIQFQISRLNDPEEFKFFINLGVNWNGFRFRDTKKSFTTNFFTVHNRLERLAMATRPGMITGWIIRDETNPSQFATYVVEIMKEFGLPFIDRGNDIDYVLSNFSNIGLLGSAGGTKEEFAKFVASHKIEAMSGPHASQDQK